MFIEISPDEGVFDSNLKPLTESYRLNLNFIRKVFFEKEDDQYITTSISAFGDYCNKITFEIVLSITSDRYYDNQNLILYFNEEGRGKYHRIKRIIDENTFG